MAAIQVFDWDWTAVIRILDPWAALEQRASGESDDPKTGETPGSPRDLRCRSRIRTDANA
jgi:hypothetical protein